MHLLKEGSIDRELLERFEEQIISKLPHWEVLDGRSLILNPTPLLDITEVVVECARRELGIELNSDSLRVLGKFESKILTGSVKIRPAAYILHDAIKSGRLKRGDVIFEATSGNFGIALGLLAGLGIDVIALVSRRLQEGVFYALEENGVNVIDLDVDICPAPGIIMPSNLIQAKVMVAKIRERLNELKLDTSIFDKHESEIEDILAKQDVINLAKLLAKIYNGFCPEQYDNELNILVHRNITAPEIDQQLNELNYSLNDFLVVCTFGTGGTSGGISRYVKDRYKKKNVYVAFPLQGQDVAGIRSKDKAFGLRFYEPELYAGELELDFNIARKILRYFVKQGYDIGESSALAIYAAIKLAEENRGNRFVVILADGIEKYEKLLSTDNIAQSISIKDAREKIASYDDVIWAHTTFTPKEKGIEVIAKALGCSKERIKVLTTSDVANLLSTNSIPDKIRDLLNGKRRLLLICMAGGTSLAVAKILSSNGIGADSLSGGILEISSQIGEKPFELVGY